MNTKNTLLFVVIGFLFVGGVLYAGYNGIPSKYLKEYENRDPSPVVHVTKLPDGEVMLHVRETAIFSHNSIRLMRIFDDSRCAEGITCIWAGTVKAEIESVTGMGTSTEVIELGKTITVESETITLNSVSPYPKQGSSISQAAYVAMFEVRQKSSPKESATGACYVGGCSGQICSGTKDMVSTCEYREQYACFKTATCERQATGKCGWIETSALKLCISNAQ